MSTPGGDRRLVGREGARTAGRIARAASCRCQANARAKAWSGCRTETCRVGARAARRCRSPATRDTGPAWRRRSRRRARRRRRPAGQARSACRRPTRARRDASSAGLRSTAEASASLAMPTSSGWRHVASSPRGSRIGVRSPKATRTSAARRSIARRIPLGRTAPLLGYYARMVRLAAELLARHPLLGGLDRPQRSPRDAAPTPRGLSARRRDQGTERGDSCVALARHDTMNSLRRRRAAAGDAPTR